MIHTTWMNLKIIMVFERRQKECAVLFHLCKTLESDRKGIRGCLRTEWKERNGEREREITKELEETFSCDEQVIFFKVMVSWVKLYTLNMYSLLHVNYTVILKR